MENGHFSLICCFVFSWRGLQRPRVRTTTKREFWWIAKGIKYLFSANTWDRVLVFFWRIYSFLVFGILVKSSGLVGLHFIVLPWWVTPRCKDFKECLKKILTLTMLCNVDNTHQLLHTNLISKVAGLLLDSGANSKLRNNQGLKKNNSQYLSIECINSRELGRPQSIKFFIFFRENKASFPRTKKGRF